ncbi:efflux RND transporter periplasmic adaptor subunit [Methylobacterium sp. J-076]|uniref:efflux RND transporter periplasmic adaptor subunit n=1 Tax=Methylobacterium sp. J-076 TaxID=2836655 RepID=UPI001FBB49AF|nr:efflux RND transporter periplasmic adaptor subunit [Methylobacterium sp. J-076]MCJ2013560.1 efflux RND transporter periplasmic adaptor subunit [Methylobacterium sp. J-076]
MSRAAWLAGTLAALAAGGAGYRAGQDGPALAALAERARAAVARQAPAAPAPSGPVVYYRDPDGKPVYSLSPMVTEDGREFRAVHASEDVRFDGEGEAQAPAAAGRRVLYYRNPMGLPDVSATPRKDAMGMDYIPVREGEEEDGGGVTLSPGKVQRTGVRTEAVARRAVGRTVRVPGTVTLDERRIAVVATRSDAYVDHVEDVTTGDRVRKGEALVRVYSPEINAAAAQLIANPGFDGARRRLQNLNVSQAVIAEMERTRTVPMAVTWGAPRDGVVLQRMAVDGMKAAAGDTLFRIADTSLMWVLADVPERDLAGIRVGQDATLRLHALPGRVVAARVAAIYPQVNPETRATRVRLEVPNPDGALLPDMYAEVAIATAPPAPVLAVPDDAVIEGGPRPVVLLDRGGGRFEPRPVTTGAGGEGYTEIREGVAAGDRVVVAGNFLIDAESNLKAALRGMAPGAAAGTGAAP